MWLIFLLLFSSFSLAQAGGIDHRQLPFALIGGIVALWVTGEYLSVPASVGFINLFGVAVFNGIVFVSYMNTLRQHEEWTLREAMLTGCVLRCGPS